MQAFISDSTTYALAQQSSERCVVSAADLVGDTKRFLEENYRGCYREEWLYAANESVSLVPGGYAEFLKIIFKSVFANHLITLSAFSQEKAISIRIGFDTSLLDTETRKRLAQIAEISGFSITIYEREIVASFRFLDSEYSAFHSILSSFIYDTLKKVFLD